MNILLTGGRGYIGTGIARYLADKYNIILINKQMFDLRDPIATQQWFAKLDKNMHFDAVIHTAIKGGSRLEKDSSSILDDNIKMYLNLLDHRDKYKKFINIGSGAEVYNNNSFYGKSKEAITLSLSDKKDFYNLRIYGIFDENELERRFIKNNICQYVNKNSLIIYKNKYMDFIYFADFIKILTYYLNNNNLSKNIDCVYKTKYTLFDIAQIINQLDDYRVDIQIENSGYDIQYTGTYHNLKLEYLGLKEGIIQTYRKLKDEKNMVCSK